MAEIDMSYYPLPEREQISRGLLENLTSANDWKWNLQYHPDPEGDSRDHIGTAYYTLSTESRKRKLTMTMVIGRVPWHMVTNFWFTKDKKSYSCREDSFKEVSGFRDLGRELYTKAEEIRQQQEQELQRGLEESAAKREAKRLSRVRNLLNSLGR